MVEERRVVAIGDDEKAVCRAIGRLVTSAGFKSEIFSSAEEFLRSCPERQPDCIPALVTHFVHTFSDRVGKQIDSIPPETMAAFQWYSWPGNIRELQNLVERAVIFSRDGVLPNPLHKQTGAMAPGPHWTRTLPSSMTLEESDRALIVETLKQVGWVVGGPCGAAAKLGLKRTTLLAKMRRLAISRPVHQEGTDGSGLAPAAIRWKNAH